MYQIKNYSYQKAKLLDVEIKPSTRKDKKIDVFNKDGKYIVSIGAISYNDYPTYLKEYGKVYANERRKLYHERHKNDKGKAGYYAKNILW